MDYSVEIQWDWWVDGLINGYLDWSVNAWLDGWVNEWGRCGSRWWIVRLEMELGFFWSRSVGRSATELVGWAGETAGKVAGGWNYGLVQAGVQADWWTRGQCGVVDVDCSVAVVLRFSVCRCCYCWCCSLVVCALRGWTASHSLSTGQ